MPKLTKGKHLAGRAFDRSAPQNGTKRKCRVPFWKWGSSFFFFNDLDGQPRGTAAQNGTRQQIRELITVR
jgi:hypothetical protein